MLANKRVLITSDNHRGYSTRTHKIHDRWAETLKSETWDITLLAGDMASHKKDQFKKSLKFWREVSGDRPILLSRGNHDLWDRDTRNLAVLRNLEHHTWFEDYKIHHLETAGPYYEDGFAFVGWDGWYCFRPQTNDLAWMSGLVEGDTWTWLQAYAWRGFQAALFAAEDAKKEGRKVIAMTHMPIIPSVEQQGFGGTQSWWEHIQPFLDYFVYGHTHRFHDEIIDGVRVLNCGSDYDKPKHLIVDL